MLTRLTGFKVLVGSLCLVFAGAFSAQAQDAPDSEEERLAKRLANPIAALISVPFQFNYDSDIGPADDGERATVNIQPVIPVTLNEDWNIISRTIVPIIWQDDILPDAGSQFGIGDVLQSFFFSPSTPTAGGIIWGVGPVFRLPTATDDLLGAEKWGLGPSAIALRQAGGWTYGALFNHVWSVAGDDDRADINATFLQPFVSFTNDDAWTFSLQTETVYDWDSEEWAVPVNISVSKLLAVGGLPISLQGGLRYWAESADSGPEDLGFRLAVTFLFPK